MSVCYCDDFCTCPSSLLVIEAIPLCSLFKEGQAGASNALLDVIPHDLVFDQECAAALQDRQTFFVSCQDAADFLEVVHHALR